MGKKTPHAASAPDTSAAARTADVLRGGVARAAGIPPQPDTTLAGALPPVHCPISNQH